MITEDAQRDEPHDGTEPARLPPLRRWVADAPLRLKGQLALGTVCALGYAGTTAALANLVHWLSKGSSGPSSGFTPLQLGLILAVLVRPLFFVAHVYLVTGFIGTMGAMNGIPGATKRRSISRRMIMLIILTRDLPLLLVLTGVMLVQAGAMGIALAGFVLTGLLVAKGTGKLAHVGKPAPGDDRMAAVITFRRSRSMSQAGADVPFIVLVLLLVVLRDRYPALSASHLTTVALSAMLLGGPTRRLARLFATRARGQRSSRSDDEDDD